MTKKSIMNMLMLKLKEQPDKKTVSSSLQSLPISKSSILHTSKTWFFPE